MNENYGRKPKQNYSAENMPEKDRCQTPAYAIDPLLPYIKDTECIWEPAEGEGLLSEALLTETDAIIYATDILDGDDFFEIDPIENINKVRTEVFSYPSITDITIVTNPPFSLKYKWLERCYELDYPFALLMPSDTLFASSANRLFQKHGIEVIIMNPRVDFKMPNKGWQGKGSDFATAWFTWKLNIGQMITFADISEAKKKFKASLDENQNVLD